MNLLLLRHGKADWPDWKKADDERPLNEEGIREMHIVGAALKRLKVSADLILSSPLPRALRTAELVADELGLDVGEEDVLKPGFDRRKCDTLLARHPGHDVMLVGHEPNFSSLVRSLTGGQVKFAKGGVAAIEVPEDTRSARLLWLFPAKTLIRLYR